MTKLVYKQIQQLNYKKETACSYEVTRCLAIGFFVCFPDYFTSSKSTIIHYQCVSTRCCTHVAKTEITIDNQYVTKLL